MENYANYEEYRKDFKNRLIKGIKRSANNIFHMILGVGIAVMLVVALDYFNDDYRGRWQITESTADFEVNSDNLTESVESVIVSDVFNEGETAEFSTINLMDFGQAIKFGEKLNHFSRIHTLKVADKYITFDEEDEKIKLSNNISLDICEKTDDSIVLKYNDMNTIKLEKLK